MTGQTLNSVVWVGTYFAYALWLVLGVLIGADLVKRKYVAFKIHLLYLINSGVLILAYGMILYLALIVQGPKDIELLRQQADEHFKELTGLALCVTALLTIANFFYLKLFIKANTRRHFLALLAFDAVILFTAAYVTSERYFQGLRADIGL